MTRKPNWDFILNGIVERSRAMPFEWGVHDCCLFACDVIERITVAEIDLAEGIRGHYHTKAGAARILKQHGVRDIEELALKFECRGLPQQSLQFASRGDLMTGTTPATKGMAAGICIGEYSAFVGKEMLVMIPTLECSKSWRI